MVFTRRTQVQIWRPILCWTYKEKLLDWIGKPPELDDPVFEDQNMRRENSDLINPYVEALCQRVIVLEGGRVVLDGTPEAVRLDPRLQEIYFGTNTQARSGA